MAFLVYRPQSSTGARVLSQSLNGSRVFNFDPVTRLFALRRMEGTRRRIPINPNDVLVCWGSKAPEGLPQGVKVLNGTRLRSKYDDAVTLREAGVATIEVSRTRPPAVAPAPPPPDPALQYFEAAQQSAEEFTNLIFTRGPVLRTGVMDFQQRLSRLANALAGPVPVAPPVVQAEWIGRQNNHVGGDDILHPTAVADYFAKKENFIAEYRVHSFKGRSIRAGKKIPREGMTQHPWIRSWDGGWKISYDGVSLQDKRQVRELAHAACAALGLDFGAVDIGERADGSLCVLEVNRAPGIEAGTVDRYTAAIRAWAEGTWENRPPRRQRQNGVPR